MRFVVVSYIFISAKVEIRGGPSPTARETLAKYTVLTLYGMKKDENLAEWRSLEV